MGQYFYITNVTRNEVANGGEDYGKIEEFEMENDVKVAIKEMCWDKNDEIYVMGDSDNYIRYEKFEVDEEDVEDTSRDFAIYKKYSKMYDDDCPIIVKEMFEKITE